MHTGIVKWFNDAKGYGFLYPVVGNEEIFIHFSKIKMDGYRTLQAGQIVKFELVMGPKGVHATNIIALNGLPNKH